MKTNTRIALLAGASCAALAAVAVMGGAHLLDHGTLLAGSTLLAGAATPATPSGGAAAATNPIAVFGQKLEAFFEGVKDKVIEFADAFLPEAENDLEVGIEDIAELCGAAVMAQAPAVISGQEKFGNAVDSVVQQVEAGGKTIAQATAQAGVQQAFLTAQQIAKSGA